MNHDKPLISIIVPIYNVADYLPRCLDSIVAQTYRTLDIILIDDGSTDRSGDICDQYALTDSRIRVIHQPNGGLSSARNAGLDIAKGEYIAFVDSDDFVDCRFIETLYSAIKISGTDISAGDLRRIAEGKKVQAMNGWYNYKIYSPSEAIEYALYQRKLNSSVCGKIFRRSLFDKTRFKIGILYEDLDIFYKIYELTSSIAQFNVAMYYYVERKSSIIKTFSLKRLDVLDIVDDIERRLAHNPALLRAAQDRKLSANFNILALLAANGYSNSSHALRCWQNIKSLRFRCLCNNKVRLKNKLGILVSFSGCTFTKMLFRAIGRIM